MGRYIVYQSKATPVAPLGLEGWVYHVYYTPIAPLGLFTSGIGVNFIARYITSNLRYNRATTRVAPTTIGSRLT